jgi:transposase
VIKLRNVVLIHDLKRRGLSVSAIARQTGFDRKTIRKYLDHGLENPTYGPRKPRLRLLDSYENYLHKKITDCPGLSGRRLLREITALGYTGGYSAVTEYLREVRPGLAQPFERRFETDPGKQAQVDFAEFGVTFTDQPDVLRKVWLFSFVLGNSRWLWGRFCPNQKLETVMRCHILAFGACGGAPREVLYDRMKTAVLGEDEDGSVIYNPSLVALLSHYDSAPKACKAYRAKTKGKVERPFRYIRQDFFLGRTFRDMDDLNARFDAWRTEIANPRVHATTNQVINEAFAQEQPKLLPLPLHAYDAVITVERRITKDGMISVAGNLYSVPDYTRRRIVEVQQHPMDIRIFEDGLLIARHPVLEGKKERRIEPGHRKAPPPAQHRRQRDRHPSLSASVPQRSLAFYDAAARRMATGEVRS